MAGKLDFYHAERAGAKRCDSAFNTVRVCRVN